MMVSVSIDDQAVLDAMARLSRKAGDLRNLMRELAGTMHDAVEENFEKQGRPRWQSLRPSTIRQRTRKGTWPGNILQVRGRLAASIQERSTSNRAIVGTNVRYAAIHQFGGEIKRGARSQVVHFTQARRGQMTHSRPGTGDKFARANQKAHYAMKVQVKAHTIRIPARPFLQLIPSDHRRIMEVAERYLKTAGGVS